MSIRCDVCDKEAVLDDSVGGVMEQINWLIDHENPNAFLIHKVDRGVAGAICKNCFEGIYKDIVKKHN
jgi:hypothetical protein